MPDSNGEDLIKDLVESIPRPLIVLGTSGDPYSRDTTMSASADGFIAKPITSLAAFQETILANLPADRHPHGPRIVTDETICPDPIAYQNDMDHVAQFLGELPAV